MTIILYLVTVMNIGDTLGSRRQSRSLTQNLFVGSQHASHLIYPPSLRLRWSPRARLTTPVQIQARSRMLLICSLSSIHLTRPRQCSHAHTPEELSSQGWHEIWDLTAAWRHGHDQALYSATSWRVNNLSSPVSKKKFWQVLARKERLIWMVFTKYFLGW